MMKSQAQKFYENLSKSDVIEFRRMKENSAKFKFAEHLAKKYKKFFKFNPASDECETKDDNKSISFRIEGSNLHNKGRYQDALKAYNKSLCFAISDENLAIGYANRSASCFEMGRFSDCRENIALARKFECLQEPLKRQLHGREEKCRNKTNPKILNDHTLVEYAKSASFDKNPNIPFLSNRVSIKDENSKHWIYAKEYLEEGVVVIKEKCINPIIRMPVKYLNCQYCLNPSNNLIPCRNCTYGMFCNEECMKRGNAEFHKWECSIMDLLYFFDCELVWLSFRLLVKMLNVFGDYAELKKYWKRISKKANAWHSFEADKFDDIAYFEAFHAIQPKVDDNISLGASVLSAFFTAEAPKYCKPLKEIFRISEEKDLFGEIILHNMLTYSYIGNVTINDKNSFHVDVIFTGLGSVLLPELKRSATPNVVAELNETHLYFVTTRPILKDELLSVLSGKRSSQDNYGNNDSDSEDDSLIEELIFLSVLNTLSQNFIPFNVPFGFR